MKIRELIQRLPDTGDLDADVFGWDPDAEAYVPITGWLIYPADRRVVLQTDSDDEDPGAERYQLKSDIPGSDWVDVTKEEWIKAERAAGFRPKLDQDDPRYMQTCATSSFSGGGMSGRIR
jgi:hypothetical protein